MNHFSWPISSSFRVALTYLMVIVSCRIPRARLPNKIKIYHPSVFAAISTEQVLLSNIAMNNTRIMKWAKVVKDGFKLCVVSGGVWSFNFQSGNFCLILFIRSRLGNPGCTSECTFYRQFSRLENKTHDYVLCRQAAWVWDFSLVPQGCRYRHW